MILRGVNKMIVWTDPDGIPSYSEIARTGANAVRIVWESWADADGLRVAIENCLANDMIPLVELHDATGNWSLLQTMVDYWTRPDVVAVIQDFQEDLLVNIANECGSWQVTDGEFRTGYELAITRMRQAGIRTPLVIDATGWGRNIDQLQAMGPGLLSHDPDHNLVFSTHMYWGPGYEQFITDELAESAAMGLPLIVGEFNQQYLDDNLDCRNGNPYLTIMEETDRHGIGWLAWSWGPGNNPCYAMDMTTDNTYESLHGWGLEVAVTDPHGIENTSVRPHSIVYGTCSTLPVSSFEVTPSNPSVGQPAFFTDTSTGDPTSWHWDFGDGTTSSARHPSHAYSAPGSYSVTLTATNVSGSDAASRVVTVHEATECTTDGETLCLNGDRFRIQVTWTTPQGASGAGQAIELTNDTGLFWFFRDTNVELVIKVLEACGVNGSYWVFAGGLTSVETEIVVTDTENGEVRRYENLQGDPFQPIQDTSAFGDCP